MKHLGTVAALAILCQLLAPAPQVLAQCQRAKLTADDGAPDDWFGYAVDICGDIAVIGAHHHDHFCHNCGAGYVFERSGPLWLQIAELVPPDGGGFVGRSVGIDGDLIVLGAMAWSTGVYERVEGVWTYAADIAPDEYELPTLFGIAADVSGETILVGDPEYDGSVANSGAAYVFERDPNDDWPQVQILEPTGGVGHGEFGYYLALDANVGVMGAPGDEEQGNWSGAAYVFERDPNGVWHQAAKLLASDGGPFTGYGYSVAVSAGVVMVGASDAHGNEAHSGAVYVYERDPNGVWPQVAKLIPTFGGPGVAFGRSVVVDGDLAVIGDSSDRQEASYAGAAYVFHRLGDGTWSQVAKLTAEDGAAYDRFGVASGLSGNTAIIGAYKDDDHGADSGSAYVFAVGPDEDGDGIMDVCLCPGDLDHDLDVDLADLAQLLSNYGTTGGAAYEDGDLDEDGDVDLTDLAALLAEYGMMCP
ncbi:MAG: FG-GAP repeat protein [Planctomycetes bacterium]|nr:FG-GAP repeat protein [Planctomycetota bacterium]